MEGWSGVVKGLWDRDRETGCPLKVIILGSAPWSLLTGTGESLAGRFMPLDVGHWSLQGAAAPRQFSGSGIMRGYAIVYRIPRTQPKEIPGQAGAIPDADTSQPTP